MSRLMSREEWRAFLSEGTRTGKLATVRRDGSPHVVPIWFILDGDDLVFTTGRDSIKGHSIRRDGRVALCVDDDRAPYAFVTVAGRATVSEDLQELLHYATRLGARYMGEDRAEAFGRRNAVPGELLVRLHPERVLAIDQVAG
jgi:PPOX class probable F420-dependent enzyme